MVAIRILGISFALASLPNCVGATWFDEVGLRPGPYPVGMRIVIQRDPSRLLSNGPDRSLTVPICIWYPAAAPKVPGDASQPPMRLDSYLHIERETLKLMPPAPDDRTKARVQLQRLAQGAFSEQLDDARADRILDLEMLARRDAPAAPGRFPVVVGGLESPRTSASIGEYFASRGYIVVTTPSTDLTQDQQGTRPLVALETQTRNLEFLAAFAQSLPEADLSRLVILGVNFNGMAALIFGMRNLGVSAVVSLDGYEGKAGFVEMLRSSPHFDPARFRAPYLLFLQHELSPPPTLILSDSIFDSLRASSRETYAIEGLRHAHYVLNLLAGPASNPTARRNLPFVLNRVGDWMDAHVQRDSAAQERLRAVPEGPVFIKHRREAAANNVP